MGKTWCYRRAIDITPEDLKERGIRGLLLDIDNTLTTYGSTELAEGVLEWLDTMKTAGIALTVVSNALDRRIAPFAEKLGLRHISLACKPSPIGFWRAARRVGLPLKQCAAVGDQIFTDWFGTKFSGVSCFLLEPIRTDNEKPFLRLRRRWEKPFRRALLKKGVQQ
ncbi:MAG: YqeG family HAD IIIA-type phosphatase [Clostridia bacterium]|nr:YqeG family HAD IIIA-type phosphatase [Clostridia bacterium]